MRVFLAGEGRSELGHFAKPRSYWPENGASEEPGVLEAFLVQRNVDFEVVGATLWKKIHKYRAGQHRKAEERNVRGLMLIASEARAKMLVFVRDRDGDAEREERILSAMDEGMRAHPDLRVVGGLAVEAIEAWILELLGDSRAATHRRPKDVLRKEHGRGDLPSLIQVVESCELPDTDGQSSLSHWLRKLDKALETS